MIFNLYILVCIYFMIQSIDCIIHCIVKSIFCTDSSKAPAHCGNIFPALIFKLKSESGSSCRSEFS